MAKFSGYIGFAKAVENPVGSGVYVDSVIEKQYKGDLLKNYVKWQGNDKVNKDISLSNQISIVSDSFANGNLQCMKYVKWKGTYWEIDSVSLEYPRIVISIGGVYNGVKA